MDLKLYAKIDVKTKLLIDGYIHNIHKDCDPNGPCANIPILINYVTAIFYFSLLWDEKRKGSAFCIDHKDRSIITKGQQKNGSAFVTDAAEHGVHTWTFELIQYTQAATDFMIGIWDINNNTPELQTWLGHTRNTSYVFLISRAILNVHDRGNGWTYGKTYGITCSTGDIIAMCLNLNALTLSFSVNGKSYGVSHKVKRSKYVAGIGGTSVTAVVKYIAYETAP